MSSDGVVTRPGDTSGREPETKPSRGERLHRIRYRLLFGGLILAAGGVILNFNIPFGCHEFTMDPLTGVMTSSCGSDAPWTLPEWVAVPLLMLSQIAALSGVAMAVAGLGAIALAASRWALRK